MTRIPDFLYWYRARCVKVIDGDTIDVVTDLGFRMSWEQRVRLYGVDTQELNDPDPSLRTLAVRAKEFATAKVEGKDVILNTFKDRKEKYGRWLAVVYFQDDGGTWRNLNTELLGTKLAIRSRGSD